MKLIYIKILALVSVTSLVSILIAGLLLSSGDILTAINEINVKVGLIVVGCSLIFVGAVALVCRMPAGARILRNSMASNEVNSLDELRNLFVFQGILLFGFLSLFLAYLLKSE